MSRLHREQALSNGAEPSPLAPGATPDPGVAPGHATAAIGPNAVLQLIQAMDSQVGPSTTDALLKECDLTRYRDQPPEGLIEEQTVIAVYQTLRRRHAAEDVEALSAEAGRRTAAYLLEHRIPAPAAALLRILPAPLSARALLRAIAAHAWTFAGSSAFEHVGGPRPRVSLLDSPLCRERPLEAPGCTFYLATFEALFRALVHRNTRARTLECRATGGARCSFELSWSPARHGSGSR